MKDINKEYFNTKPVEKVWKQNGKDKMLKNLRSISNPRFPKDQPQAVVLDQFQKLPHHSPQNDSHLLSNQPHFMKIVQIKSQF